MGDFLKALLAAFIAFAIFTFPATWLLMLFFGNIGCELSYIGTLPMVGVSRLSCSPVHLSSVLAIP